MTQISMNQPGPRVQVGQARQAAEQPLSPELLARIQNQQNTQEPQQTHTPPTSDAFDGAAEGSSTPPPQVQTQTVRPRRQARSGLGGQGPQAQEAQQGQQAQQAQQASGGSGQGATDQQRIEEFARTHNVDPNSVMMTPIGPQLNLGRVAQDPVSPERRMSDDEVMQAIENDPSWRQANDLAIMRMAAENTANSSFPDPVGAVRTMASGGQSQTETRSQMIEMTRREHEALRRSREANSSSQDLRLPAD